MHNLIIKGTDKQIQNQGKFDGWMNKFTVIEQIK